MQNLITSMVRFSTALTLFSLEQIEQTVSVVEGDTTLAKTMDRFEEALNSLTDVLTAKMDDSKKETLNSVVNTSEDLVKRTMDSAKVLDPRDMLKAGNDLLQKTTTATSEWVSKAASAVQNATRAAQGDSKSDTIVTN